MKDVNPEGPELLLYLNNCVLDLNQDIKNGTLEENDFKIETNTETYPQDIKFFELEQQGDANVIQRPNNSF